MTALLDSYIRHARTLLCALFFVALVGNLIPRETGAVPIEVVGVEVGE